MNPKHLTCLVAAGLACLSRAADVYLVESNPNAASPYDSWATAATDYATAFAQLGEGGTLWISNGNYSVAANAGTIPKNATVCAVNGPAVTKLTITGSGGNRNGFILSSEGATLSGLHVYNGNSIYYAGAKLSAASTLVTNCIIDTCFVRNGTGGIVATAGLVVDTTVANCDGCEWTSYYGPRAVNITGTAVMDRCRVVGQTSGNPSKGAVCVASGGILRNSLIMDNNVLGVCGIWADANGTVENCTVLDNITRGASSATVSPACALYVAALTAVVRNTIVVRTTDRHDVPQAATAGVAGYEACLTDCFFDADGDPHFADPLQGDYSLHPDSPCVGAGTVQAWMGDARDLGGNPRTYDSKVDIGCYQYAPVSGTGAALFRTMIGATKFAPQTNELKAVISPADLSVAADKCWWTFDGSEPTADHHAAEGKTVTNVFARGTHTVRFRFASGDETYGPDRTDWLEVKSPYVYLDEKSTGAEAPYDTWATAATSFADAFACLSEGQTMIVSNGTYSLTGCPYTLPKYASIRSVNGPTNVTFSGNRKAIGFLLSNYGSVLSGLRLYYLGDSNGGAGAAVVMSHDARVENCILDACRSLPGPGALSASEGSVVGCKFINGSVQWSGERTMAATGSGTALFDRCIFTECSNSSSYDTRGAVAISGGATIRNSFVQGNSAGGCAGIYLGAGGHAENCTVTGNSLLGTPCSDSYGVYLADATATATNVLAVGNVRSSDSSEANLGGTETAVGTCFTSGDPKFADVENGDYTLQGDSPCIEAGTLLDWMTADAIDLAGHPRLRGTKPDIGCYEYWETEEVRLTLTRNQLSEGDYAPMTWEFRVGIQPTTLEYEPSDCWWTFDGTEPTADRHAAEGTAVTNVFWAATNPCYTVSFALKVGDTVYRSVQTNWIEVLSDVAYVVKENPNAAPPYATWATAATNIGHAYSWLRENSTLWISNGVWNMSESSVRCFQFPTGAKFRSVNGPDVTTLDYKDVGACTVFYALIGHNNLTVSGLRIINTYAPWGPGVFYENGNAPTSGALFTNCVFESCECRGGNTPGALALYGTHTVVDCVFSNCYATTDMTHAYGQAFTLGRPGALADRCRIYDSRNDGQSGQCWGAVSVTGGATIRNSLVTGCRLSGCAGIYVGSGSFVVNCTVASNVTLSSTSDSVHVPRALWAAGATASVSNTIAALNVDETGAAADAGGVDGAESRFVRCAVPGGFGTDPIAGDPKFRNAAARNFRLRRNSSPCVNAAYPQPWMTGAKDLDGNPRVQGSPDVGCYETSRGGAAVILR